MILRTTAAGVWLAAICSIAAPSAGFCEVRTLPGAEGALAAQPPDERAGALHGQGGLVLGELTFSPQPQAGVSAAQDLPRAALNTITAPPQALWRRWLSAVVQLGAASR